MTTPSLPPQIGAKAPLFALPNQNGELVNPSDSLGKYVVIYFYPKALTSGCTIQACELRDHSAELSAANTIVFGISPDAPKLLLKFKNDKNLPFELLSDAEHKMALAYDTWKEKSMYGRTYMGMMRDSYVLDPSGIIIGVLRKVSPTTHFHEVMKIILADISHRSKN
jgi:peroxiredoxin Q/BCP